LGGIFYYSKKGGEGGISHFITSLKGVGIWEKLRPINFPVQLRPEGFLEFPSF